MGSEQHVQLWDRCLTIIKDNIEKEAFEAIFKPVSSLSFEDNLLSLFVPSHFVKEQIEENYLDLLRKVLPRVYGPDVKLEYRVLIVQQPEATVDLTATTKSTAVKSTVQSPLFDLLDPFKQRVYDELDPRLNPIYTFESYHQGASNMLARSAAEAIAANPGRNTFNPLFLFGESGVGKTHLIQAIGLRIKENNPASRVLYLSAHDFLVQYTDAVRNNRVNDFIAFYQSVDVLLMDDIQEFAGKTQTQNTFFHIFNHLHQSNKQLVLTCDRPPVELVGMVSRLLTRFKWGLTAEVERPDYALRYDILMSKVRRDGLIISPEVIDYIARHVTDNVRDLEGVIVSLMVRSSVLKKEISIDMADQVLAASVKMVQRQITIDTIKEVVCTFYGLDSSRLLERTRKREVVVARQMSMYLAKKYTSLSLAGIGDVLGKKDHATVLHACKTITEQVGVDKKLRSDLEEIEQRIQQGKE